jgi:hypothetical protein
MKCFPIRLDALALVASFSVAFLLGNAAAQSARPYAGMQARAVKALSAEQIADLKAGRGMSLALAAELNGYPGPRHVLELGDQLGLSDQQRADVQRLFDAMTAEAIPLGEKLIAGEAELDALFARRAVMATSLGAATAAIGAIQAELRNNPPEISSVNLRITHSRAEAALLRIARLRRRGYRTPAQAEPLNCANAELNVL